jgi:hypothetical protein
LAVTISRNAVPRPERGKPFANTTAAAIISVGGMGWMRKSLVFLLLTFIAVARAIAGVGGAPDPNARPPAVTAPRDNGIRVAQNDQISSSGNPSVAPLKWVGLLVNPVPTQKSPNAYDACTGQFIKPNIVLTAAHCIKDLPDNPTGPWYDLTKQTFVLQYQNGEGSQTFKTVCAATAPGWSFPADYSSLSPAKQDAAERAASGHDFALVLVNGNSPTGAMPYALDWKGEATQAVRIGYAADILDGEIVQQALGIVFFANAIPMFPDMPSNLVVHWQSITDFTEGSSGGAWIANFSTGNEANSNILIAVTSFRNTAYPGAILAAYLTAAEFNPLLQFVSNGCK